MSKKMTRYTSDTLPTLSEKQEAELAKLAASSERAIDTQDIPELSDEQWKTAVRGRFYKPNKMLITTYVDSDVIAWIKSPGRGYQSRINAILRREMLHVLNKH